MSVAELKVVLKGEDWTYTQKFLIYEEFSLSEEDPFVGKCIKEATNSVKLTPEDISFKINKVIQ